MPSICVLDQCSLEQKARVKIVEVHVDNRQEAVMKIIVLPAIITDLIRSRLPDSTYLLLNFSIG